MKKFTHSKIFLCLALLANQVLAQTQPHMCKTEEDASGKNEGVFFSCQVGKKTLSFCVSDWPNFPIYDRQCSEEHYERGSKEEKALAKPCNWNFKDWHRGQLTYRFGVPGEKPELEYPSKPTPIKQAFQLASLHVDRDEKGVLKKANPSFRPWTTQVVLDFQKRAGFEIWKGFYTELWFNRGAYTYTFFDQTASAVKRDSKTSQRIRNSGAGMVVEKNGQVIATLNCEEQNDAIFERGYVWYSDTINYLYFGQNDFRNQSNGFRGISPLLVVQRKQP